MKLLCVKDYTYEDGEITFPFHAGTEYAVADEFAGKVIEKAPEHFEVVDEKPKGKSRGK